MRKVQDSPKKIENILLCIPHILEDMLVGTLNIMSNLLNKIAPLPHSPSSKLSQFLYVEEKTTWKIYYLMADYKSSQGILLTKSKGYDYVVV